MLSDRTEVHAFLRRVCVAMLAALVLASCGSGASVGGQNGVGAGSVVVGDSSIPSLAASPTSSVGVNTSDRANEASGEEWTLTPEEWTAVPETGVGFYVVSVEGHRGDSVDFDWDAESERFPEEFNVEELFGKPALGDPFSDGDLALSAYFDPHEDDYAIGDWSGDDVLINGRSAVISQWLVDYETDAAVGYQVVWDADPDHYVFARSRTLSRDGLIDAVGSVVVGPNGVVFDPTSLGLEPIPIPGELYWSADYDEFGDYVDLKQGIYAFLYVEELPTDEGDADETDYLANGEISLWLVDGGVDDLLVWRFLAGSELVASVDGKEAYVLEGVHDDGDTVVLVWRDTDTTIGFAVMEGELPPDVLPVIVDRLDLSSLVELAE